MPNTLQIPCLRCQTDMELGFIVDRGAGNNVIQAEWVPGAPIKRWWGIGYEQGTAVPTTALRCPQCGYVELRTGTGK